jgi:hypothetical protein
MYIKKKIKEYQEDKYILNNILIENLQKNKNIPNIIDFRENKHRYLAKKSKSQKTTDILMCYKNSFK